MIEIDAQIAEACRELDMRCRNYPRWIEQGRMHPVAGKRQIELQREIIRTLERVREEAPNLAANQQEMGL